MCLLSRAFLKFGKCDGRHWGMSATHRRSGGLVSGLPSFALSSGEPHGPRPSLSHEGLSQAALPLGVRGTRSASPTSGQADRLPVSPTTSGPVRRLFQQEPKSTKASALPPTSGLPRCYRCEPPELIPRNRLRWGCSHWILLGNN